MSLGSSSTLRTGADKITPPKIEKYSRGLRDFSLKSKENLPASSSDQGSFATKIYRQEIQDVII